MTELTRFPDPDAAPGDAPLAWGGDLEPATLLDAYWHGIFPWPDSRGELWWWSPDPRAVLPLDGLVLSRSLRRSLARYACTRDRAFERVVAACADRPGEGTWILPELQRSYALLHAAGVTHSVEAWDDDGRLVGGLFGAVVGGAFLGESMFSRARDASKVALVALVQHLRERGFRLLDAQVPNPHLASLGAMAVPRAEFLARLRTARVAAVRF